MNRRAISLVGAAALCLTALPALAAGSEAYPLFDAENTTPHDVTAEAARFDGKDGLKIIVDPDHVGLPEGGCDNCTFLALDGIDFGDGTIEIEVAGMPGPDAPPMNRGFVGIVFRADEAATQYEGVYLRPTNGVADKQILRNHTVQYFSIPDYPWMRLRDETPGQYESHAPVKAGEWIKLRIELSGTVMRLYVDGADWPVLVVNDLKHGADKRGTIGLFTEPKTDAYFRNLVLTHAE